MLLGKEGFGYKRRDGGHAVIDLDGIHPDVDVSGDLNVLPVKQARRGS